MKPVLHLITTLNRGGAENQLFTLASEQMQSGRKVIVMALKGKNELEEDFKQIGVEIDNKLLNRNVVVQILFLIKITLKFPGILHAHLPRAELLSAISTVRKKVFVTSRHNAESFFPKAPKLISILLSRFVDIRAKEILAISEAVKKFLFESLEISKNRDIPVVHYGVNTELTRYKKSYPQGKAFMFGTIARLVPQKDIPTLLRAFAIFSKQNREARLLIVGEGFLYPELLQLCREYKISENVVWAGKTDNIPAVLNSIDLFLLTSKYEGFGLVLLEAMQNGVPVIAANNSAIPEVVGTGSGNLFKTGDAVQLANLMQHFTTESEWLKLQNRGYARLAFFSSDKMRIHIDNIYG